MNENVALSWLSSVGLASSSVDCTGVAVVVVAAVPDCRVWMPGFSC